MSYYYLVTLGCFRNEVESDNLRSALKRMKHSEVDSAADAEIILVNSCGFISDACDEGIDTILKLDEIRMDTAKPAPIIVLGCMAQRYGLELMREMEEISAVLGVNWGIHLEQAIECVLRGNKYLEEPGIPVFTDVERNMDSSDNASLFIRISDGCDRKCNFCTIPSIRGKYSSRSREDILSEVEELTKTGKREVILVGQDLTCYGKDLAGNTNLVGLIKELSNIENVHWIRLLYLQPEGISMELIDEITGNPKVCSYFDIPFQHVSTEVLRNMGRSGDMDSYGRMIDEIRKKDPGSALRTTMMVGFPGEGEKEFDELCRFVETAEFDWLGLFCFSPEEGTGAAHLWNQVSHEVAVKRYNRLLDIQDSIEESKSDSFFGHVVEVVVEDSSDVGGYDFTARSYREAPVVDGVIYLVNKSSAEIKIGDFQKARIVGREGLDLAGEII